MVWILLATGLRVSKLASLTKDNVGWQAHQPMSYGKDGPYGLSSKLRVIPLSSRVRPLLEPLKVYGYESGKAQAAFLPRPGVSNSSHRMA